MEELQQLSILMNLENHNSFFKSEKMKENIIDNFAIYEEIKNLEKLFKKLTKYGEQIEKYKKKYKNGKWGMKEREMLANNNIDTKVLENYLEENTRTRKMKGEL